MAFIDILGFKEIVKQSESDPSKIELLFFALDYLKDWEAPGKWGLDLMIFEEDAQKRGIENFDIRGKTNTTTFSDSIVVSVKVDDNVNEMASTLIGNLSYIGAFLMESGILFRGGMTIGNIIHHENGTVFGQGLIDAYMLETRSAKYPRIIVSDKLLRELHYPIDTKKNRYPYHQYLSRFDDGCVGFHQMIHYQVTESFINTKEAVLSERLSKIRKVIVKGMDTSFEYPEIFEKYRWLKNEYNGLYVEDNVKVKIRGLNEGIPGQNIHYIYTDNAYEDMKKRTQ